MGRTFIWSYLNQAIDFLCRAGIIRLEKGRYRVIKKYLHVDNTSPEINQYHRNLRLKAIEAFPLRDDDSLYFSSFLTCQKEDLAEIKKKLLGTVRRCSSLIKESRPGLAAGLNIDLYKI
ncbi:MAG: DUF4423 domain-containing protein [Oligoflexales bacterium]|nr:DUF4423 domain-containing protein [Oligoflexales bacterium]